VLSREAPKPIYDEGSSLSMYVVNIILGRPVIYDEGSSLSMYVVNIILGRPVIYDEGLPKIMLTTYIDRELPSS
jgi:DUF2075 family protein